MFGWWGEGWGIVLDEDERHFRQNTTKMSYTLHSENVGKFIQSSFKKKKKKPHEATLKQHN